jgi:hypothetical protein
MIKIEWIASFVALVLLWLIQNSTFKLNSLFKTANYLDQHYDQLKQIYQFHLLPLETKISFEQTFMQTKLTKNYL